jgi:adenylosuccinate synthase
MNYVVVGANYGDEGKGLMTDYLVRATGSKIVTRFNGGAQAGHTVTTKDQRHVFGHLSAGTFAGAHTYLTSEFIVNPYLFSKELAALADKGFHPEVLVRDTARVTTIYDMAINAAIEMSRGAIRHGSCGLGINETVTRDEAGWKGGDPEWQLSAGDIKTRGLKYLVRRLKDIHTTWVPRRLLQLGLQDLPEQFHTNTGHILRNSDYEAHALRMVEALQHMTIVYTVASSANPKPVIFEGAQGLALDEELGEFPHVTRSMTGLPQAIEGADAMGIKQLQPVYVTRAYLTRHGAGPLNNEGVTFTEQYLEDKTNVHNQWQGSFRYAPLDLRQLAHYVRADLRRGYRLADIHGVELKDAVIALTCMDQVASTPIVVFDIDGVQRTIKTEDLPELVTKQLGLQVSYTSWGPTSQTVQHIS